MAMTTSTYCPWPRRTAKDCSSWRAQLPTRNFQISVCEEETSSCACGQIRITDYRWEKSCDFDARRSNDDNDDNIDGMYSA